MIQKPGVRRIEDDKGVRYKVLFLKGRSVAEPELYENQKLIMLRLKVRLQDNLGKYTQIPKHLQSLVDNVESIDIDFSLIEKFLNLKWSRQAIVKLFSTLLDVYQQAKEGDILGEIEMDYTTFEEFMVFLKVLCFETFIKDENII